jgi:hypothetical protein
MAGTNPVGTWALTNYTVDTATVYKSKIDANCAVVQRPSDNFAPRPAASPAMSVVVDAGFVVRVAPNGLQTIVEAAQATVTISAAPSSPNNRIDLVVVDSGTGVASVIAGTPGASPSPPAITAGKFQVCQVSVPYGTSAITGNLITDLRAVWTVAAPGIPWTVGGGTGDAITATFTPANTALYDGLLLSVRVPGSNATTTPTLAPDGLTAHTIVKRGGVALAAGDIPGNLSECLFRYNLANSRWELLNPVVSSVAAGGTGLTTITAHGVMLGNGTGAVNVAAPNTAGYVLTDNGPGSDPTFQASSGGVSSFNTRVGAVTLTTADVGTAMSGIAVGAVGSMFLAANMSGSTIAKGATVAGSNLNGASLNLPGSYSTIASDGVALSGTWRNMGGPVGGYSSGCPGSLSAGLFLRTA